MFKGYLIGTAIALGCLAALAPAASADTIYPSTDGFCCFSVDLSQTDANDILVTVSLTNGATLFANTGNGTNHPGFAFNLAGSAITSTNIVSPTNLSTFHAGPDSTGGPSFGTFDYFFDIPGSGTSGNDAGPLTFTVHRTGILISDFDANTAGYLFAADICQAGGGNCTGMSAVAGDPASVPEPVSLSLIGGGLLALGLLRKRLPKQ